MTAHTLVVDLTAQGARFLIVEDRLRVEAPFGVLSDVYKAALRAHKAEVLRLLTGEGTRPTPTNKLPGAARSGPCDTCGVPDVVAWGSDGGAWCADCWNARVGAVVPDDRPVPTLPEVYAGLTPAERVKLTAESSSGDRLAQLVLETVALSASGTGRTPEPVAWRLYSRRLDRELWVVRDATAAADLERDGGRERLPVVLADDLGRLREFDDQRLNDLLDVLAIFPGSRLALLEPEGTA